MRPANLNTRIFLDGGDPQETRSIKDRLGFLDGQTTNPTLISKNPEAKHHLESGKKFSKREVFEFYQTTVREISGLIPDGSVSVEVYADAQTTAEEMLMQGREMFGWIPNAHVKYPCTREGLTAAEQSVKEGMRVNLTLVFSQQQAAAVYAATKGAKEGQVFLSPFIGRLDDRGECGLDLLANIIRMYTEGDGHVQVLTASVRTLDHLMAAIGLSSDIATVPGSILTQWADAGSSTSARGPYDCGSLTPIDFEALSLAQPWQSFDLRHSLTDVGIQKFSSDWNQLIAPH
ncbi:transaldolase [Candidatus Uhrbacteria bacterium]|nr:transaldolase [Candidatus Uhrbacteria bacterium]